jgi:putative ABC transport system permease protein
MIRQSLLLKYAFYGLQRGGQRVLIAVLSVAFGVMSLVAMSGLAEDIFEVLLIDPRYEIGGDVQLWRGDGVLTQANLSEIQALQAAGEIERYTTTADYGNLILKLPGSGRVTFLNAGIGFVPGSYPLLGEISLREPSGETPAEVLQAPGNVIVTRDVAEKLKLSTGDTILLGSQLGGAPQPMRIAGIAASTPDFKGDRVYFDLQTAALIAGRPSPLTDVHLIWRNQAQAQSTLEALSAAGWQFKAAGALPQRVLEMRDTFNLGLKGAGILGLLVGGIGIANTMQVLLGRRRREIGILKSLGYGSGDILMIFVFETAMIGLVGSLLGAAAGIGLSAVLVGIASRVVTLFINWHLQPWLASGAVVTGVVTAVLFAAQAILQASEVRPADVFRQLPVTGEKRIHSLGVLALMAVPFAAIASLILGSVLHGLGVLLAALAGLVVIGGLLAGCKWLALRLMPTFRLHLLRMARNNLRRRGRSLVFAMIALFTGVFTLGLAIVVISGSQDQMQTRMISTEGYNLVVLDEAAQAGIAQAALAKVSQDSGVRFEAPVKAITTASGENLEDTTLKLQGRTELWDVSVEGKPWDSVERGAYLPHGTTLKEGTRILVTGTNGRSMTLTIAGTYTVLEGWDRYLLPAPEGLLVPAETLMDLAGDTAYALAAAEVPSARLESAAQQVGAALPQAAVISAADLNNSFNATFRNLFVFAAAMAGLALAAGAVLIANAVSLAMIERRYEIGVMKAVGYTRNQVLRTILFEYGLIAGIASLLGLAGVGAFIYVLSFIQEQTADLLLLSPGLGGLILGLSVGLTLLAALAAAWGPTSIQPVVVLNEQG